MVSKGAAIVPLIVTQNWQILGKRGWGGEGEREIKY